jgi:hypothetical protein
MATFPQFSANNTSGDFSLTELITVINQAAANVKNLINNAQTKGSSISIGDMFDVQFAMNKLSQLSEMTTNVISAANQATIDMARNVK